MLSAHYPCLQNTLFTRLKQFSWQTSITHRPSVTSDGDKWSKVTYWHSADAVLFFNKITGWSKMKLLSWSLFEVMNIYAQTKMTLLCIFWSLIPVTWRYITFFQRVFYIWYLKRKQQWRRFWIKKHQISSTWSKSRHGETFLKTVLPLWQMPSSLRLKQAISDFFPPLWRQILNEAGLKNLS